MDILFIAAGVGLVPLIAACFIKNKAAKVLLSILSVLGMFVLAVLLSGFVLADFIGAHGLWLPFVLCGGAFAVGMLLVWRPFKPKPRRIAVLAVAGVAMLTAAVFAGPEIYNRYVLAIPTEDVNLRQYMPFGDSDSDDPSHTLVKTLNEESALQLTGDLPRLDGATALYPLYSAFVRATYPEFVRTTYDAYFPYYDLRDQGPDFKTIVVCSKTSHAFENLIDGYADAVFLMGVSGAQRAMAEAKGLELTLTPIGREAFIFFVNSRNAAANLSLEDIKRIYSGQVTNWREVGGENDEIRAYQRPDESGSQTMLKQILNGSPLMPAPQEDIYNLMIGMYQRVAGYRNYKNSLGYSFLFYIRDMISENKVKFLSVDGIAPTRENILNGAYPLADDFHIVTAKRDGAYLNAGRTENIDKLIGWITSPQGQFLVDATGYVPAQ